MMRPLLILACSWNLTMVYAVAKPFILYNDSDPLAYFRKAWFFLYWLGRLGIGDGHAGFADVPSRGPGFPAFLVVTGAASMDTWWGLVAAHLVMAALMPLLVYLCLCNHTRNGALVAAFAFMAFGLPWQMMNWVMTEHLFLFAELVALVLLAHSLRRTA